MKILALLSFEIFRFSIGKSLEKLGHEVIYLDNFDEHLLELTINTFKPEIAFSMGWEVWHVSFFKTGKFPLIKELLKKYNIFHIYFAEEDWLHHDRWSKSYVKAIQPNYVLTRSTICVEKYQNLGIPSMFFDVGCNPDIHRPVPIDPKYQCDVAVVANGHFGFGEIRHKSICDLVFSLVNQPFKTKIFGKGWENVQHHFSNINLPSEMLHGSIAYTETPKIYNSAKISISLQTCNDQLSNRTFDIMSSGGFLLTSDTPAVRIKLIPGVNCVISNSAKETVEKITYYLIHEEQRIQIAKAGRDYAIRHFDYKNTLHDVWPNILAEYMNTLFL
ncbi:glycosyltransferase [Brevibacillus sp. 7WMA2]|uniref:CgeB family protein n=1 Tax=Brevibacillus sp. 7WMA2 TaxID=2683193 RepID=UPI0013A725A2|nr:glycosyltransferase [Brevibacillus sp. 7WMA2]QIC05454.1 glycosyltransferase [Brevibacillus sp. 7WMA2]